MKTQTRPQLTKHTFTGKDWQGEECTFAVFAATPEQAKEQISDGERYTLQSTETLEYAHTDLALAIAAALPGEWSALPQSDEYMDCAWYLKRADGLTLFLSPPSYSHRDKFSVSLSTPRHNGSYVEPREAGSWAKVATPSMNVSAAKSAAQMAKEIERRILVESERVHGLVCAEIEKRVNAENAQLATLKAVCSAVGEPVREYQGKPHFSVSVPNGSADVSGGGSVTFKLYSFDCEKAVKLAAFLKTL